jgi:cell division protein FtsQ
LKVLVKIVTFLFICAYMIVVLGFAGRQYEGVLCRGLDVVVRDSLERGLVSAGDIRSMIHLEHPGLAGMPIEQLDIGDIEENLKRLPAVSDAQVYTDIRGRLIVEISQRRPVARIEDREHNQYYLDREGYVIPVSMNYTPHLLHINGEIPAEFRQARNVLLSKGKEGTGSLLMPGLLKLAAYINSDTFWRSQIVQVYVNGKGEFELVPRVGPQIILFGKGEQMETKFFKLETLYREGFSHTGWNQYEIINLKYDKQVICTKR